MPKPLFYTGVIFCAVLALLAAAHAVESAFAIAPRLPNPFLVVGAMVMAVPVAALFVRMASLLAARNLFAAFFSMFSVAGSVLALFFAGALALVEERRLFAIAGMILGLFTSITLLGVRPYFRLQTRFLAPLAALPALSFAWLAAERLIVDRFVASASSVAYLAFLAILATTLLAIAAHCLNHRHLFIEVTNLRELLDTRVDPATPRDKPLRLGGVAFE